MREGARAHEVAAKQLIDGKDGSLQLSAREKKKAKKEERRMAPQLRAESRPIQSTKARC